MTEKYCRLISSNEDTGKWQNTYVVQIWQQILETFEYENKIRCSERNKRETERQTNRKKNNLSKLHALIHHLLLERKFCNFERILELTNFKENLLPQSLIKIRMFQFFICKVQDWFLINYDRIVICCFKSQETR